MSMDRVDRLCDRVCDGIDRADDYHEALQYLTRTLSHVAVMAPDALERALDYAETSLSPSAVW